MRRLSCARTRLSLMSRAWLSASLTASSVISWNSMRRTGILGFSTSFRCQEIDSPSRSGSVASRTSEASFSAARSFWTLGLLVGRDDVVRREVGVHVHAHAGPGLLLDRVGNFLRRLGEVADMADARHHGIAVPQEPLERARLCRRLDNYKWFSHKNFRLRRAAVTRRGTRRYVTTFVRERTNRPPGCRTANPASSSSVRCLVNAITSSPVAP